MEQAAGRPRRDPEAPHLDLLDLPSDFLELLILRFVAPAALGPVRATCRQLKALADRRCDHVVVPYDGFVRHSFFRTTPMAAVTALTLELPALAPPPPGSAPLDAAGLAAAAAGRGLRQQPTAAVAAAAVQPLHLALPPVAFLGLRRHFPGLRRLVLRNAYLPPPSGSAGAGLSLGAAGRGRAGQESAFLGHADGAGAGASPSSLSSSASEPPPEQALQLAGLASLELGGLLPPALRGAWRGAGLNPFPGGLGPALVRAAGSLTSLTLEHLTFEGRDADVLGRLTGLQALAIRSCNNFTAAPGLTCLGLLTGLTRLEYADVHYRVGIPMEMASLSRLTRLREADFRHCDLYEEEVAAWAAWGACLTRLEISSRWQMTLDAVPPLLPHLSSLLALDLPHHALDAPVWRLLAARLPRLEAARFGWVNLPEQEHGDEGEGEGVEGGGELGGELALGPGEAEWEAADVLGVGPPVMQGLAAVGVILGPPEPAPDAEPDVDGGAGPGGGGGGGGGGGADGGGPGGLPAAGEEEAGVPAGEQGGGGVGPPLAAAAAAAPGVRGRELPPHEGLRSLRLDGPWEGDVCDWPLLALLPRLQELRVGRDAAALAAIAEDDPGVYGRLEHWRDAWAMLSTSTSTAAFAAGGGGADGGGGGGDDGGGGGSALRLLTVPRSWLPLGFAFRNLTTLKVGALPPPPAAPPGALAAPLPSAAAQLAEAELRLTWRRAGAVWPAVAVLEVPRDLDAAALAPLCPGVRHLKLTQTYGDALLGLASASAAPPPTAAASPSTSATTSTAATATAAVSTAMPMPLLQEVTLAGRLWSGLEHEAYHVALLGALEAHPCAMRFLGTSASKELGLALAQKEAELQALQQQLNEVSSERDRLAQERDADADAWRRLLAEHSRDVHSLRQKSTEGKEALMALLADKARLQEELIGHLKLLRAREERLGLLRRDLADSEFELDQLRIALRCTASFSLQLEADKGASEAVVAHALAELGQLTAAATEAASASAAAQQAAAAAVAVAEAAPMTKGGEGCAEGCAARGEESVSATGRGVIDAVKSDGLGPVFSVVAAAKAAAAAASASTARAHAAVVQLPCRLRRLEQELQRLVSDPAAAAAAAAVLQRGGSDGDGGSPSPPCTPPTPPPAAATAGVAATSQALEQLAGLAAAAVGRPPRTGGEPVAEFDGSVGGVRDWGLRRHAHTAGAGRSVAAAAAAGAYKPGRSTDGTAVPPGGDGGAVSSPHPGPSGRDPASAPLQVQVPALTAAWQADCEVWQGAVTAAAVAAATAAAGGAGAGGGSEGRSSSHLLASPPPSPSPSASASQTLSPAPSLASSLPPTPSPQGLGLSAGLQGWATLGSGGSASTAGGGGDGGGGGVRHGKVVTGRRMGELSSSSPSPPPSARRGGDPSLSGSVPSPIASSGHSDQEPPLPSAPVSGLAAAPDGGAAAPLAAHPAAPARSAAEVESELVALRLTNEALQRQVAELSRQNDLLQLRQLGTGGGGGGGGGGGSFSAGSAAAAAAAAGDHHHHGHHGPPYHASAAASAAAAAAATANPLAAPFYYGSLPPGGYTCAAPSLAASGVGSIRTPAGGSGGGSGSGSGSGRAAVSGGSFSGRAALGLLPPVTSTQALTPRLGQPTAAAAAAAAVAVTSPVGPAAPHAAFGVAAGGGTSASASGLLGPKSWDKQGPQTPTPRIVVEACPVPAPAAAAAATAHVMTAAAAAPALDEARSAAAHLGSRAPTSSPLPMASGLAPTAAAPAPVVAAAAAAAAAGPASCATATAAAASTPAAIPSASAAAGLARPLPPPPTPAALESSAAATGTATATAAAAAAPAGGLAARLPPPPGVNAALWELDLLVAVSKGGALSG
ncbi:hypothetical protein HYH03_013667 [Edaphochlamys debaryana]|uniref:Uncharacterized protein n=1 Tax=Edaphochlamys debaryana TaxID=47281 RepID=A0A835XPH8_9CHLO|nr:hypothetical protein HYH03_013667 [Edaphochlamys debaryana]|eukprot:KAG2487666.1 hypothetical protein HYH03_013667 [Edaphochlamys debaryana]